MGACGRAGLIPAGARPTIVSCSSNQDRKHDMQKRTLGTGGLEVSALGYG
jgi:hypothetical protein